MQPRRRNDLMKILRGGRASSQEEIVTILQEQGHNVTQATVSRDLRALGAVKVRVAGDPVYRLVDDASAGDVDVVGENLRMALVHFLVDARPAMNLVVVTTPPGHASAVARALDLAHLPEARGTLAGDDTIFIATDGPDEAQHLATVLLNISEGE